MKQRFFAAFAITIIWHVLDLIFRSLFLTQHNDVGLINDISPLFINGGAFISAFIFVVLYCRLISNKSLPKAIKLGLFVGTLLAIYVGGWLYVNISIPSSMAVVWAISSFIKFCVAGIVTGFIVTSELK